MLAGDPLLPDMLPSMGGSNANAKLNVYAAHFSYKVTLDKLQVIKQVEK